MFKVIRSQLASLYKQKYIRKYSITHEGLRILFNLKPRAQKLLLEILLLISNSNDVESLTIKAEYYQLGINDFSQFNRTRKELIRSRLLFYKEGEYYVNPCYINFYSRRQMDYFFTFFKLKPKNQVKMTNPTQLRIAR